MSKYILVPSIAHRDPVIKLGKNLEEIQDNMVGFLSEEFDFPDDYNEDHINKCIKIRDYNYTSIEELIEDFERVCCGYAIQKT